MPQGEHVRPDAVAIYIRWSTEEQGEGTTLEVQRERCALFLGSQGWTARDDLAFIDEGYSGASLERPALTRLRHAIADGLVDCVVTYKLDRLSRNLFDTIFLIRQEWAGKCSYRSATEGFDTSGDSPTGGLIINILASFAEFERAVIRDRTWSGLLRRVQEGMYISGSVPFGYQRGGKGQIAPKPGEAETVVRIFEMAASTVTATARGIATHLNEIGIPTRCGGKWQGSTVARILANPVYTGTILYGRSRLPPTVPGGNGRYDAQGTAHAAVSGVVPAIITWETFVQAHANLCRQKGRRPKHTNRANPEYLLTTIARCRCGGPLGGLKDRQDAVYYRCQRQAQGAGCPAGSKAFKGGPVERRIVAALRERFGGTRRQEALAILRERHRSSARRAELERALAETERRKAKVREDLTRLRRQVREGELKASTYEEIRADVEADLRELEERMRTLRLQIPALGDDTTILRKLEQAVAAADEWHELLPADRKELLRSLCEELIVFRPKGEGSEIDVQVRWIG